MLGLIQLATHADETFWVVVRVFALQMCVGLVVGIIGGLAEARLLPRLGRYTAWMSLALAACVFGAAALAHGSGFLAVFVAGLIRGDVETPRHAELLEFRKRLATVAEIVVFVALGLTIEISGIELGRWAEGLLIAAFAAVVARPAVVATFLARVRLDVGERAFVAWAGSRERCRSCSPPRAPPPRRRGAPDLQETVFVVVLASVVIQGSWTRSQRASWPRRRLAGADGRTAARSRATMRSPRWRRVVLRGRTALDARAQTKREHARVSRTCSVGSPEPTGNSSPLTRRAATNARASGGYEARAGDC